MPSFERLLALRFSWILVRLGVIVGLTLSLALPAASALKDDAKDLLGEVEDSKVEPEKEKDAEPIGPLVLPGSTTLRLVDRLRIVDAPSGPGAQAITARRRDHSARGPPLA